MSLPEHLRMDPNEVPKDRYLRRLPGNNDAIHSFAARTLRDTRIFDTIDRIVAREGSTLSSNIEILATGSDGRNEKGPLSPIEIIILLSRKVRAETRESVERTLESLLREEEMFSEVEAKNLHNGGIIFRKDQADHTHTWPTVIIDSKPLLSRGRPLLDMAKRKLFEEYREHRKRILSAETDRRGAFAQTCRGVNYDPTKIGFYSTRGKTSRHFNIEEGIAIYDPRTGQKGFKYGPLRLIQASLGTQLVHVAQTPQGAEIISTCPANTVDKLSYLHNMGALHGTPDDISELGEHYQHFLWEYHRSEHAYHKKGTRVISFDRDEVRERLAAVVRLDQVIRGVKPERR